MVLQNPFFHRGPIRQSAYFYGRTSQASQALALIKNGQSLSIVGPRRIGKTSLLFHLANPTILQRAGFVPKQTCCVYIDCESWRQLPPSELYSLLWEELRDVLTSNQVHLPETFLVVPHSYRTFERVVREVVSRNIQVIFLLDEFQALSTNPHLDADFFSGLRILATRHQVVYITASTQLMLELTYQHHSALSSPFFNFFAQIRLSLFDLKSAEALLTGLATMGGVQLTPPVIRFLLELAGPHPLLLQVAGYHAFELFAQPSSVVDQTSLETVRARFLDETQTYWSYFWQTLPPSDQRVLALLPVIQMKNNAALQRLINAGLGYIGEHGFVSLSPAFQAFVQRQQVSGLIQAPPITLDPEHHIAVCHHQALALSPTEFDLLACLIAHTGQVVSHSALEAHLWPNEHIEDPQRLSTALKTLRRALGDAAVLIESVRGVGYRFAYIP